MTDKNERYFVVQIQDAAFHSQSNHCILHKGYLEFWNGNSLVACLDDSWQTPNPSINLIKDGQLLDIPPTRSWWLTPLKRSDVNSTPVDYLINSVLWLTVFAMCTFIGRLTR